MAVLAALMLTAAACGSNDDVADDAGDSQAVEDDAATDDAEDDTTDDDAMEDDAMAFIGVVAVLLLTAFERRALRWHPSQSLV